MRETGSKSRILAADGYSLSQMASQKAEFDLPARHLQFSRTRCQRIAAKGHLLQPRCCSRVDAKALFTVIVSGCRGPMHLVKTSDSCQQHTCCNVLLPSRAHVLKGLTLQSASLCSSLGLSDLAARLRVRSGGV